MSCNWNVNIADAQNDSDHTLTCRCNECGKYADLDCDRDFASGQLVVQIMTCVAKGGLQRVRDAFSAGTT